MTLQTLRRSFATSLLATLLAASTFAAPAGVYTAAPPSPTYKSDAPAPREAEHSVSADGAASYVVPFDVPPGRAGAQPQVALHYSSRAPIRGGIAAGWTLPIPMISVDTSQGRFGNEELQYQVGGSRLIEVDEPAATGLPYGNQGYDTYRADGDTSYTRYERHWDGTEPGYWIARAMDGSVAVYGQAPNSKDLRVEGTPFSPLYGGQGRWLLSSTTDTNGNLVEYTYETVYGSARTGAVTNTPVDLVLKAIDYGKNVNDPSSTHHARVDFIWQSSLSTCLNSAVPIGAQFTYRTGIRRYEGARKLLAIRALVWNGSQWVPRRELTLHYDPNTESCAGQHAPFRQLSMIQLKAWSPSDPPSAPGVVLPAVTFGYSAAEYTYPTSPTQTGLFPLSMGKQALNNEKPGGWPTTEYMVADLAGGGIVNGHSGSLCESFPKMPWANGVSPGGYSEAGGWLNGWEGCSLTAQVTHRSTPRIGPNEAGTIVDWSTGEPANYYGYQFLDVNGDGRPDLLAELDYQKGRYRPSEDPAISADYPACSSLPEPPCMTPDGQRVACLYAPLAQTVMPLENGSGWIEPYSTSPGDEEVFVFSDISEESSFMAEAPSEENSENGNNDPQPAQCPADTCVLWGGPCTGTVEYCCSANYCSEPVAAGCQTCPPMPNVAKTGYVGSPYANSRPNPSLGNIRYGHVPDLHCGYYVYRVYLNESTGDLSPAFNPTPHLVRSPVPLDSIEMSTQGGSSKLANASAWRAIVDIDGDDRPDALYQRPNYLRDLNDTWPEPLRVWLGSQSGTDAFTGASDGQGLLWHIPPDTMGFRQSLHESGTGSYTKYYAPGVGRTFTTQGESVSLHDINGDGLLDLVRTQVDELPNGDYESVRVFYNTGGGFEDGPGTMLSFSDFDDFRGMSRRLRWSAAGLQGQAEIAVMTDRQADLDGDGLVDVISLPEPEPGASGREHLDPLQALSGPTVAYFNAGDRFLPVDVTARLGRFRTALAQVTLSEVGQNRTVGEFTDLNGDGLPDMVMPDHTPACTPPPPGSLLTFDGCAQFTNAYHAAPQPLRLLTRVDNSLGGYTEFSYAPMRDEAVVTRDDEHPRTVPLWVVKSKTVGIAGQPPATTEYRYINPVHKFDRYGRFGFRGFETVVETGPAVASGARRRVATSYRYDLEETGLVSRQLTAQLLPGGDEELVSVGDTDYVATPLFDGDVRVFQVRATTSSTCAVPVAGTGTASVDACLADAGVSHSVSEWTPHGPAATPALYAVTTSRRFPGTDETATAGVRHQDTIWELRYEHDRYQLLASDVRTRASDDTQHARVHTIYDAAGNPLETQVDIDDQRVATTSRTFDEKGNVLTVISPNQQSEWWPLMAIIYYDEHDLYPLTTVNELGQATTTVHDLATGVVLERRGPVNGLAGRLVEQTNIDGLGRVLSRSRGIDDGQTFAPRIVFRAEYDDTGRNGGGVRSITTHTLLEETASAPPCDEGACSSPPESSLMAGSGDDDPSPPAPPTPVRWVTTVTKLDPLGRIVEEQEPAAEGTRVTTYTYHPSGLLVRATFPDAQTGEPRWHEMEYDGLGRVVRAIPWLDAPIVTTYAGLTTIVEQTATDGAPSRRKEIDRDGFGRIVSVTEGITDPVTTVYEYDELDRVAMITDADGIVTTLGYDQRGLRTEITRGQTTIRYGYDDNGNRITTEHPTGGAPFDPLKDISHWSYDPLNRLVIATHARRDWTDQDYLRYGPDGNEAPDATVYTYDEAGHGFGVGRLTRVETPVLTTDLHYTAEGLVEREVRSWSVAPEGTVWSGSAEQTMTYGPAGHLLTVTHPDGQTASAYTYDDRGRPGLVEVTGAGVSTFARFERNAAGFVTHRLTPASGVRQTWFRDAEGRVTATEIHGAWGCAPDPSGKCPIGVIGGESLTFNSLGEVWTATEHGQGHELAFSYDERGQLVYAETGGSDAYYGRFTYSGAGRLLAANVTSGLPLSDVTTRTVSYDYTPHDADDTADPAAVRALRDLLTDEEIVTLVYDPSGNLTARTSQQGDHTFIYDAVGKLREAIDENTGCFEVYYYDHAGERALTYRGACGEPASVRHRFGGTEIFHQIGGTTTSTVDVGLGDTAVLRVTREAGTTNVEQLFHGGLGSLLVTTDATGQGTARFGYGPWGEVLYAEGPNADAFDRRFNGKPVDKLTQLRYYGARYYDPLTLTWTQADPYYRFVPDAALAEPLRMGLYVYSLNDPSNNIDPDGFNPKRRSAESHPLSEITSRTACVKVDGDAAARWGSPNSGWGQLEAGAWEIKTSNRNLRGEYSTLRYVAAPRLPGGSTVEGELKLIGASAEAGADGFEVGIWLVDSKMGVSDPSGVSKMSVGVCLGLGADWTWKGGKLEMGGKVGIVSFEMEADMKKGVEAAGTTGHMLRWGPFGARLSARSEAVDGTTNMTISGTSDGFFHRYTDVGYEDPAPPDPPPPPSRPHRPPPPPRGDLPNVPGRTCSQGPWR